MKAETDCAACFTTYVDSPEALRRGPSWRYCPRCRADREVEEAVASEVAAVVREADAGRRAIEVDGGGEEAVPGAAGGLDRTNGQAGEDRWTR
jgi:hypothetical protein